MTDLHANLMLEADSEVTTLASTTGTPGDDQLTGTNGDDTILAGAGDDTVLGLGGNDYLAGQLGDDQLNGGSGDDTLIGAAGANTLLGGSGDDLIYVSDVAKDLVDGGSGRDTASFALDQVGVVVDGVGLVGHGLAHIENVIGSPFDDTFRASSGRQELSGEDGDDALYAGGTGGGRGDKLFGGRGNDHLFGGFSADTLSGGGGHDSLEGNGGADVFLFGDTAVHGRDTILDLESQDTINLKAIDANTNRAGDQAFVLRSHFHDHHAGQAVLIQVGRNTDLLLDTNGDGVADITVRIDGHHADFTNFVL